jgi:hypothetical protein
MTLSILVELYLLWLNWKIYFREGVECKIYFASYWSAKFILLGSPSNYFPENLYLTEQQEIEYDTINSQRKQKLPFFRLF